MVGFSPWMNPFNRRSVCDEEVRCNCGNRLLCGNSDPTVTVASSDSYYVPEPSRRLLGSRMMMRNRASGSYVTVAAPAATVSVETPPANVGVAVGAPAYVPEPSPRRLLGGRILMRNRASSNYVTAMPAATVGYGGPAYIYGSEMSPSGALSYASNVQSYRSYYSPPESGNQATIEVLLPDPAAQLCFDDKMTEQKGANRVYISPALDPAKIYTYTVKVTCMENGKEVERTADVRVQGGRATVVDFRGKGELRELKGTTLPK
jgi:uncharacterized protein (TIGR03000 family)